MILIVKVKLSKLSLFCKFVYKFTLTKSLFGNHKQKHEFCESKLYIGLLFKRYRVKPIVQYIIVELFFNYILSWQKIISRNILKKGIAITRINTKPPL